MEIYATDPMYFEHGWVTPVEPACPPLRGEGGGGEAQIPEEKVWEDILKDLQGEDEESTLSRMRSL